MSEADEWSPQGANILSPQVLAAIRRVLDDVGPAIVEHWHYRGSRSPDRLVFDGYDQFVDYVHAHAIPGDLFRVYDYAACCREGNELAVGKYPDANGRVPRRGAY